MRRKRDQFVLRSNGYFHLKDRQVKAVHHGDGYGVDVVFKVSPLDVDFGLDPALYEKLKDVELHWFPSEKELKDIRKNLDESNEKTWKLRGGKGWTNGPRPYVKLHEFV
jgi:hypothetical protein